MPVATDLEEPVFEFEDLVQDDLHRSSGGEECTSYCLSDKLIAIGFESGYIKVIDYNGDTIWTSEKSESSVLSLALDSKSEYLASGSSDGLAIVQSLCNDEVYQFNLGIPITAVCIDPRYSTRKTKEIILGDAKGQVHVVSKGWLGPSQTTIFRGKHSIKNLQWNGRMVSWISDSGVRIYDASTHTPIGSVPGLEPLRSGELANLQWISESQMILGWNNSISRVFIRRDRISMDSYEVQEANENLVRNAVNEGEFCVRGKLLAIHHFMNLFLFITTNGSNILLHFVADDCSTTDTITDKMPPKVGIHVQSAQVQFPPQLERLDGLPKSGIGSGISFQEYLMTHSGEFLFFVFAGPLVVGVRQIDLPSRLRWLVQHHQFEKALQALSTEKTLSSEAESFVCDSYMKHLVENKDYGKAAALSPTLLKQDVDAWERWVTIFARDKMLPLLVPFLPYKSYTLSNATYSLGLSSCLQQGDYKTLLTMITQWPEDIYDVDKIEKIVRLHRERNRSLWEISKSLAVLYSKLHKHEQAVELMVEMRDPDVLNYIVDHKQQHMASELASKLMLIDEVKSIKLLVEHFGECPPAEVVKSIFSESNLSSLSVSDLSDEWSFRLYNYLEWLHRKDPLTSSHFDTMLVELFARFDRDLLMDFLQSSTFYSLDKALEVCRSHSLLAEEVYVLGRMGSTFDALQLLVHKLRDVPAAVKFASESQDALLWEELIHLAKKDGELASKLLLFSGQGIDPYAILSEMPEDVKVPHLQSRILESAKRMRDEVALQQNCVQNINNDCLRLFLKLYCKLRQALEKVDTSYVGSEDSEEYVKIDLR
eukprot:jgi/Picsp_1/1809/NSC_05276-R1_vacuolar protein sorting-associated protein 41 homolog